MWLDKPLTGRSATERTLVLSFDDGPGPGTLELAQYLAEENIRAIFFVTGKQVRRFPGCVSRLGELGHEVGNHGENHLRLTDSSVTDRQAYLEFLQTAHLLSELQMPQPWFFRPAYGAWNGHLAHLLNGHISTCLSHTGPVNWDIDGGDYLCWRDQGSAQACAELYVAAIEQRQKGIVLMHDFSADDAAAASRNQACQMVRVLIPRLRDLGYSFTAASELPDLQKAAHLGLRCALQAANGRYADIDRNDPLSLRATSRSIISGVRLYDAGDGLIRMESSAGTTLWPELEVVPVSEERVAFQTPNGFSLACDPVTFQIEIGFRPTASATAFQVVPLGGSL